MKPLGPSALLLLLVACTKETTPAGPVGAPLDLRAHLPADVRAHAPSDDKAKRAEIPIEVHGVKAKIAWRTFEEGPHRYLVSAQWEVDTPASGITLEPAGPMGIPTNAGTAEAVNEQLTIGVRWHDHNKPGTTSLGDVVATIRADGTGKQP